MLRRKLQIPLLRNTLFSLLLVLASCSDSPAVFSPLTTGATILAFGDSLTAGNGAGKALAYPAVLQQLSGLSVINAGISGEVSRDGLRRLPALLEQHRPALVIICHGGNDMLRRMDLQQTKHNLQQMIDLSRQYQAQVLLIAVPQPKLSLQPPLYYQQLATENQLPINLRIMPEVLGTRGLKSDTYHPNAAGYREIAQQIYQQLQTGGAL